MMFELVRGTEERQRRVLTRAGLVVVAVIALIIVIVGSLPERRPLNTLEFTLQTPSVGQGVEVDSNVLLRGAVVGQITSIAKHDGQLDVGIRLDKAAIGGLTDSFGFDFRPQNSFGLSAISLTPREGGGPLYERQRVYRMADANATMAQMLNGMARLVPGVLTDDLTRVIRDSTDYSAALAPLIETGSTVVQIITEAQREDFATTLRKTNNLVESSAPMLDALFGVVAKVQNVDNAQKEAIIRAAPIFSDVGIQIRGLFKTLGEAFGDHDGLLLPFGDILRTYFDSVSAMIQGSRGGLRFDKLLSMLNDVYSDLNGIQDGLQGDGTKSFKLRLVLEPFPALQSIAPALVSSGPGDIAGTGEVPR